MTVGHPERTAGTDGQPAKAEPSATRPRPVGSTDSTRRPAKEWVGGRIPQIDALRVLSCLSVVAVHALGGPFPPEHVGYGLTSFFLHYSREIFFFVSAVVLVRTYYPRLGPDGRLPDPSAFRVRRLRMVGAPYLWWTTIYYAISLVHERATQPIRQVVGDMPLRWVYLVVTGNGDYHMYFMLVTLQFAVVFPAVLWLLRKTQGYHVWILLVSLAVQTATLYCYQWVYLPLDGWRGLLGDASLPCYQFWLVAGAVAGLHLERIHDWLMSHWRLAVGFVPVAAAVLVPTYYIELPGRGALGASSPLQPVMILWSLAVLAVLYLISVVIMQRAPEGVRATFSYLALLSFGVYLAHPLLLDMVLAVLRRAGVMAPKVWVALVALAATVVLTVALCAILHRTRFSLPLMGRPRVDPAKVGDLPRWVRPRRPRLALVLPAMVIAGTVGLVLSVGSDQIPPTESGTPNWVDAVQVSDTLPQSPDQGRPDNLFECGGAQSAPHSCPLETERQSGQP
jgi:peptidoglycan/LPS O-acetylase OafA/YrhL